MPSLHDSVLTSSSGLLSLFFSPRFDEFLELFSDQGVNMKARVLSVFTGPVLRRKARMDAAAIVVLAVLGPFGTYEEFNVIERFLYWGVVVLFAGIIFEFAVPGFLYSQRLSHYMGRWPRFLLGVSVGSVFALGVVTLVEYFASVPIDLRLLPKVYFFVFFVATTICYLSFMSPLAKLPPSLSDIDFERIAFFYNHPDLKRSRIRWISMEDHYARVVLDNSEVMLHTTMRELEQQLRYYPGTRVHRSHWVANDAIKGIDRNGRTTMINVGTDTKIPLGKTYQKRIEALFSEIQKMRSAVDN